MKTYIPHKSGRSTLLPRNNLKIIEISEAYPFEIVIDCHIEAVLEEMDIQNLTSQWLEIHRDLYHPPILIS